MKKSLVLMSLLSVVMVSPVFAAERGGNGADIREARLQAAMQKAQGSASQMPAESQGAVVMPQSMRRPVSEK